MTYDQANSIDRITSLLTRVSLIHNNGRISFAIHMWKYWQERFPEH